MASKMAASVSLSKLLPDNFKQYLAPEHESFQLAS